MILGIWVVSITIQLTFLLSKTIAFARQKAPVADSPLPLMSIVVAARNEEENLQRLIPRLLEQEYEDFEVIIALDRCTDGSLTYLKELADHRLQIVQIDQTPKDWNSKKHALSTAIKKASGDWLALTDADCFPSKRWLSELANSANQETQIVIGYSPYTSNRTFLQDYIQYEAFSTAFLFLSNASEGKPYMAVGRNLAIRKSYFEEVGGYSSFKSVASGDDDLFIQKFATKKNCKAFWGNRSLVETFPEKSWRSYFNQKLRHFSVSNQYKRSDQLELTLFHISHLMVWLLLPIIITKPVALLFLVYLGIKWSSFRFVALRLGKGFNYFRFPIVDMVYSFSIPVMGLIGRASKKIKWKN